MINNEARYEAAKQANIKANRRVGNRRRWIAESGEMTVMRCTDFLMQTGAFDGGYLKSVDGGAYYVPHPVVKAASGDFYRKMADSLNEWGRLTPGQERAVLEMIARSEARVAERAAAQAAKAATAQHVGTVGERATLTLTVGHVHTFEGRFGTTFILVCETPDRNVVVYKGGSPFAAKGETVTVKATIAEHGARDGVAQTIIKRPKVEA